MLININTCLDFSLPKDVKEYERFSFVTGEKQETRNNARGHHILHNQMKVITKKSEVLKH